MAGSDAESRATRTLPVAIWRSVRSDSWPATTAISLFMTARPFAEATRALRSPQPCRSCSIGHRQDQPLLPGAPERRGIARVRVSHHATRRVVGKHTRYPFGGVRSSIADDHHAGML